MIPDVNSGSLDSLDPLRQQESKSAHETDQKAIQSAKNAFTLASGAAQLERKRKPAEAKRPDSPPPLAARIKVVAKPPPAPVSAPTKRFTPPTFSSIIAALCTLFSRCWPWSKPASPSSTFRPGITKREPKIVLQQMEGANNLTTIFGNKTVNIPSTALRDLSNAQDAVQFSINFPQGQVTFQPPEYLGAGFEEAQHAAIIDFHDQLQSHVTTVSNVGHDDLWFKNFMALHTPAALDHEKTRLETHFKPPLGIRVMQHATGETPFSIAVDCDKDKVTSRTTVIYEVYDRRSNESRGHIVTTVNRTIPWTVLSGQKPTHDDIASISYTVAQSKVIENRSLALEQYHKMAPGTVRIEEQLKLKPADGRARQEMTAALPGIIQEAIAQRPEMLASFEDAPLKLYKGHTQNQAHAAEKPVSQFVSSIGRGTDLIVRDGERVFKLPPRTYSPLPGVDLSQWQEQKNAWIAKAHRGLVLFFLNLNMEIEDHQKLLEDGRLFNAFILTPEVQEVFKELNANQWIPLIESAAADNTVIIPSNGVRTALESKGYELSQKHPGSQRIHPELHRGKYPSIEITLRRSLDGFVQGFDYQTKGDLDLAVLEGTKVVETVAQPVVSITAGASIILDQAGQPTVRHAHIGIESPYVAASQKEKLFNELQGVPTTQFVKGESLERITSSDGTRSLLIPHSVRVDLHRAFDTRLVVTFGDAEEEVTQCAFVMPKKPNQTIEDTIIKFYDSICKNMPPTVALELDVRKEDELNPWFNNMLFLHSQGGWTHDLHSSFEEYPNHAIQHLNLDGKRQAQATSVDHQIHLSSLGMTSKASKIWQLAKRENLGEVDGYVVSSVNRTIPLAALSKTREQLQKEKEEGLDQLAGGTYQIEHSKLVKDFREAFDIFHSRMAAGKMIEEMLQDFPKMFTKDMIEYCLPISLTEGEEQILVEVHEPSRKATKNGENLLKEIQLIPTAPVLDRDSVRGINFEIIDGNQRIVSEDIAKEKRNSQGVAQAIRGCIQSGDEKWERVIQCLSSSAMSLTLGRAVEPSPQFNLKAAELHEKYDQPNVLAIGVPKGRLPLVSLILHRSDSEPHTIKQVDVRMDIAFNIMENPGTGGTTVAIIEPEAVLGHLEAKAEFKDGKLVFEIDREKTTLTSPLLEGN